MSIYHTVTKKVLSAQAKIEADEAAYIKRGGKVTKIPRGIGSGVDTLKVNAMIALKQSGLI